jgi:hypothetical protein
MRGAAIGRGFTRGTAIGRAGMARGAMAGRAAGAARLTFGWALAGTMSTSVIAAPSSSAALPTTNPFIRLTPCNIVSRRVVSATPLWVRSLNAPTPYLFGTSPAPIRYGGSFSSHPVHAAFIAMTSVTEL